MYICSTKEKIIPVNVPWRGKVQNPIRMCPGFEKKELAIYKVDAMALCQFGCAYCSSNCGNLMRFNNRSIEEWSYDEVGQTLSPRTDAKRFYMTYPNIVEALETQLIDYPKLRNIEGALQFGMLVDNFSPIIVKNGTTLRLLQILLQKTKFKIRILTKSAAVSKSEFIELFNRYPDRVTVGLSCGSLNSDEIRYIELNTSLPQYRAATIRTLQDNNVRTFLMACPILPGFHSKEEVEELYYAFNPEGLEAAWCEPYNDRANWKQLLNTYINRNRKEDLELVMTDKREWAKYALTLAKLHYKTLKKFGFKGNSYFLLYESGMTEKEIAYASKIPDVLFQGGLSK